MLISGLSLGCLDIVGCYLMFRLMMHILWCFCGLKWSFDLSQMASGGNDNKLFIWDARNTEPLAKFSDHQAAVKAIGWNPH